MLVRELMTQAVHACTAEQPASDAAQLMWKFEVGVIPVVDGENQPIGMITDRDICLAAYRSGRPLAEIAIGSAMSKGVFTCRAHDSVADAERTMRDWQILRLPVVDAAGKLVGILSLSDVVRRRAGSLFARGRAWVRGDVLSTLEAVGRRSRQAR